MKKLLHSIFPALKKRAEFKRKINGFFDNWKVGKYHAVKGPYILWIGDDFYSAFNDEGSAEFLSVFSEWERKLLWKEAMKAKSSKEGMAREAVNKEFNL